MRPTRILHDSETITRRNLLLLGADVVTFLISCTRLCELIGVSAVGVSKISRYVSHVGHVHSAWN